MSSTFGSTTNTPPPGALGLSTSALSMRAVSHVSVVTRKSETVRALPGICSGPTVRLSTAPAGSALPPPPRRMTSVFGPVASALSEATSSEASSEAPPTAACTSLSVTSAVA